MASSLSDLSSAGRQDVILGYTLCRPRTYLEGAEAEKLATTWFLETVAASVKGLELKLAEVILISAKEDILKGRLRYKSPGFNSWALSPSSLPDLLRLCAKVRHAGEATLAKAAQWIIEGDGGKIADAVHELWGYTPSKATRWRRPPEPIDWEKILKRLVGPAPEGLEMPLDRAMDLTDAQIGVLLGGEPDATAMMEEKMFGWFELICDVTGKQPDQLTRMEDGELSSWMMQTMPEDRRGKPFDVAMVRPFLKKYAEACEPVSG